MTTLTVPNTPAFSELLAWLKDLAKHSSFGMIRTPGGADFVIARPEQLAELDVILSDPAFLTAAKAGIGDLTRRRVTRVKRGLTLGETVLKSLPADAPMATAVEQGVQDLIARKVTKLRKGQSLRSIA